MFDHIDKFYNPKCRHGLNCHLLPVELEKRNLLSLGSIIKAEAVYFAETPAPEWLNLTLLGGERSSPIATVQQ